MSKLQERLNHIGELVRGLSEQTSGNITIINSNCQMLANRLEALEKRVKELEDFNTPAEKKLELLRNQIDKVDKRLEDLETKTASDLSQTVVAESATSEEQDCLWLARSKSGRLYSFIAKPEKSLNGEHWNGRNILYWGMSQYKSLTYENSPQKLVLESSISKTETVGKDVLDKLRALLSRIDKDYEENLEYSHYEEGQQDLIKEIREVIE